MNLSDARLTVAPGSGGVVCRTPGAVLFVAARTPVEDVARLLDGFRIHTDPQPAQALARHLAVVVGGDTDTTLPGFALVAASPGGIYVKAYGAVEVHLRGAGGDEVVGGAGSFTGADRELAGPFHAVVAHRSGEPTPAADPDLDVTAGTAAGEGFVLVTSPLAPPAGPGPGPALVAEPAPAPADDPAPQLEPAPTEDATERPTEAWSPPTDEVETAAPEPDAEPPAPEVEAAPAWADPGPDAAPAPPPYEPLTLPPTAPGPDPVVGGFTSQLLGALDPDDEVEVREPLPIEPDPSLVRTADQQTSEVVVQGVVCPRGHFNDPRSRFCSSCGVSMAQTTQILTRGPRPPLGVIVFEDGATFSLSSDYVVGRQPEASPLVQSGEALALQVEDPERSISRAHAELRLVDWDVHLVNLSETNGSFVWDPTTDQWIPIPAGQSVLLTPGMRVALGRRAAVFESSLVR